MLLRFGADHEHGVLHELDLPLRAFDLDDRALFGESRFRDNPAAVCDTIAGEYGCVASFQEIQVGECVDDPASLFLCCSSAILSLVVLPYFYLGCG